VRVVSGAVRGGAALVVQKDSTWKEPPDFKGQSVATPQLGNTQDIACRQWFIQAGMNVTMAGGDVNVVPTPNSSMLSLFTLGRITAAWTVEPWVSRLEKEAGGKIVYSEPAAESITTILSCSKEFQSAQGELLRELAAAHAELTAWILEHPEEAQTRVANELTRQMKSEFPLDLVQHAWPRLVFDNSISAGNFAFSLKAAQTAGFIKENPDISGLVIRP
jgi:NitT/TauT family transport system substrate-binding protein